MAAQLEITTLKKEVSALEPELQLRERLSFDGQFYGTGGDESKSARTARCASILSS